MWFDTTQFHTSPFIFQSNCAEGLHFSAFHLISRGAVDGVATKREFMMIRVCGNYNSEVEPLKKKIVIMVVISSNTHEIC